MSAFYDFQKINNKRNNRWKRKSERIYPDAFHGSRKAFYSVVVCSYLVQYMICLRFLILKKCKIIFSEKKREKNGREKAKEYILMI